jgi:hypothetical protein
VSAEHAGKSDEAACFKAEVTRLLGQGYTMDEVARIFRIRNGHQREAFKRKYTPPAVLVPSPVAPGPAVPPEGHEGFKAPSPSPPPLDDEELDRIEAVASHLAALRAHGTRGRWLYQHQRQPDTDRDVHVLLSDIRGYGFRLGELVGESSDHDACFVTSAHNTDFPADMLRLVAEVRRLHSLQAARREVGEMRGGIGRW